MRSKGRTLLLLGVVLVIAGFPAWSELNCPSFSGGGQCQYEGHYCEDALTGPGRCKTIGFPGACVCDPAGPPGDDGGIPWGADFDEVVVVDLQERIDLPQQPTGPDGDSSPTGIPTPARTRPWLGGRLATGAILCVKQETPLTFEVSNNQSTGFADADTITLEDLEMCLEVMGDIDDCGGGWQHLAFTELRAGIPSFEPKAAPGFETGPTTFTLRRNEISAVKFLYRPDPEQPDRPEIHVIAAVKGQAENDWTRGSPYPLDGALRAVLYPNPKGGMPHLSIDRAVLTGMTMEDRMGTQTIK